MPGPTDRCRDPPMRIGVRSSAMEREGFSRALSPSVVARRLHAEGASASLAEARTKPTRAEAGRRQPSESSHAHRRIASAVRDTGMANASSSARADDPHAASGDPHDSQQSSQLRADPKRQWRIRGGVRGTAYGRVCRLTSEHARSNGPLPRPAAAPCVERCVRLYAAFRLMPFGNSSVTRIGPETGCGRESL